MSLKRRNTSSPEPDESPASKRQRASVEDDSDESFDHPVGREHPRSDPVYGQKGAFPGLDDDDDGDDELFYGPPSDGLEYLRMVRSEAKGVPHLLVAPRVLSGDHNSAREGEHNGEPDDEEQGGYYADGAYTAAPSASPTKTLDPGLADVQDLYHRALSARFQLLNATLKCHPPLSAVEALSSMTLISLPPDVETAQSQWRHHLQSTDPLTVQLACMDSESVLEVVKLLTGMMAQTVRSRGSDKIGRFGAWVWGVLGRCRDRTELGSEEIAVLRELGKRAVKLLVGIREKAAKDRDASQRDLEKECEDRQESMPPDETAGVVGLGNAREAEGTIQNGSSGLSGPANEERDAAELEAAKKRLQASFMSTVAIESRPAMATTGEGDDVLGLTAADEKGAVDEQIRITLNMILTIVGDFYGQRDLLEFRDIWHEE